MLYSVLCNPTQISKTLNVRKMSHNLCFVFFRKYFEEKIYQLL